MYDDTVQGEVERHRKPRSRAFGLHLAVLALVSCGGMTPVDPSTAASASDEFHMPLIPGPTVNPEVAAACFATAGAKRSRSPSEPASITVKHVLVKHAGAKSATAAIKRTREEACVRAILARDKIRGGSDLADVVKEFSDEAGAVTREGSLGAVERKDLAQPFADAAFELAPNQLSDVVETEFGFHVIFRTQ